jgi:hypothetical protein
MTFYPIIKGTKKLILIVTVLKILMVIWFFRAFLLNIPFFPLPLTLSLINSLFTILGHWSFFGYICNLMIYLLLIVHQVSELMLNCVDQDDVAEGNNEYPTILPLH